MADLSKIKLNGTTYNFKDATARAALANKQDTLTAGTNITIEEGVISATGNNSLWEQGVDENDNPVAGAVKTKDFVFVYPEDPTITLTLSNTASGIGSHAEGSDTIASGDSAHAEGCGTTASGDYSHAGGDTTIASGYAAHAEGKMTTASGWVSHAEGEGTKASSANQHVQGKYNVEDATGEYAFIIGNGTTELNTSNAFTLDWSGNEWLAGKLTLGAAPTANMDAATKQYVDNAIPTIPTNVSSFTNDAGYLTSYTETDPTVPAWAKAANKPTYTASEVGALPSTTVIPTITDTYSSTSHNGMSGVAVNSAITTAIGNINSFDIAVVSSTSAVTTPNNHTIYFVPQAVNSSTHDEYMYINNNWELIGTTTIDLSGYLQKTEIADWAKAANKPSYTASEVGALPSNTDLTVYMIKGTDYVTAGQKSGTTLGELATAEGYRTTASGYEAHAEGYEAIASGESSHAEGADTTASGQKSHAEGSGTTASGNVAHAEGSSTTAAGNYSHAEGEETIAQRRAQHVFGIYNIADTYGSSTTTYGSYIEIVGNGSSNSARSNARTLDWSGNETLAGKLTVGTAPTANMDVTTKQYVDTAIANITHPILVVQCSYDVNLDKFTINSTYADISAALNNNQLVYFIPDASAGTINVQFAGPSTISAIVDDLSSGYQYTYNIDSTNNISKTSQQLDLGGGITTETDPVFTASPAASITTTNITSWNNKSTFSGSYNDLTNKPTIPAATTVTNTLASGTLIATINGTNIYAPSYTNGDNLAYGGE